MFLKNQSGVFLFDGAQVEIGLVPIEAVAAAVEAPIVGIVDDAFDESELDDILDWTSAVIEDAAAPLLDFVVATLDDQDEVREIPTDAWTPQLFEPAAADDTVIVATLEAQADEADEAEAEADANWIGFWDEPAVEADFIVATVSDDADEDEPDHDWTSGQPEDAAPPLLDYVQPTVDEPEAVEELEALDVYVLRPIEVGAAVFPDPADVRLGIVYGPTGGEFTGTLVVGGAATAYTPRRSK